MTITGQQVNDVIKVDLETGKPIEVIKFEIGNVCMISRGRNAGRVGVMQHIERHPGSFDIVSVKDGAGHVFATRLQNIFTMGHGTRTMVSSCPDLWVGVGVLSPHTTEVYHWECMRFGCPAQFSRYLSDVLDFFRALNCLCGRA